MALFLDFYCNLENCMVTFVEIPPNNSFIKLFDFDKAKIMPIYKISVIEFEKDELIEKDNNNIRETRIWVNNKLKNVLIQILKNHSEEFNISVKKANGLIKMKIWIII